MYTVGKKICALCFAIVMACVPLFAFGKLNANQNPKQLGYKGVLNLWHVETFEGGSGSRGEFLKKRAIAFEEKNKGVLVSVQTYTLQQVQNKLKQGDKFDVISFSGGVGYLLVGKLSAYNGKINVRDDLLSGGMLNGEVYGVPWAFGGYMLCAFDDVLQKSGKQLSVENAFELGYVKNDKHKTKVPSLGIGFAGFNNPFALLVGEGDESKWSGNLDMTSFMAYQGFLDKKFSVLLGTQRDVSRLQLKKQQGKLGEVSFTFLGGYTDLVQYMGFCDNGNGRGEVSQSFMEYITSDECQKKLTGIEMFSPSLDIYSSGLHGEMQKALSGKLTVPNVFTDGNLLLAQRNEDKQRLGL